jgi:hypothetical protein
VTIRRSFTLLDECLEARVVQDNSGRAPAPLFEFWKVALNPTQDRGMGHGDSLISHHDHQIPQAQLEAGVPVHAQNDNLSVEVPAFEQIFDPDEPLHILSIARHPRVCTRAVWIIPPVTTLIRLRQS